MIEAWDTSLNLRHEQIEWQSRGLGGLAASSCTSPRCQFHFRGGLNGRLARWCVVSNGAEFTFVALPALCGLTAWVSACACLADGKHVVAADSWGQLACWEFCGESTEPVWKVANAHDGWIRGLDVSPDGRMFATCGRDGRIVCWSSSGQCERKIVIGGDLFSVLFAADGRSLQAASRDSVSTRWTL